ncbi:MAG: PEP-CTERM sorting domain-containing protein [Verrucomicrobiales bacterium]|nr:PEP-CTERM sorting domain-containing protein [Verrucomicrobiales bacterium]
MIGAHAVEGIYNTYTGATNINGGILEVNGAIRGSAFTVNAGGTLAGGGDGQFTGRIGSLTLNAGGTVAPGSSPGILGTGNVTTNGGTYAFEIGGLTRGFGHDQLVTDGTINLGASVATLKIDLISGYIPASGDTYYLWLNDGIDPVTGEFVGLPEGALFPVTDTGWLTDPSDSWQISYVTDGDGVHRNDIALTYIPEPSGALLTGGVVLLALLRRRRGVA